MLALSVGVGLSVLAELMEEGLCVRTAAGLTIPAESLARPGMRLLLADTRRRGDVSGALALIDRLAASKAGVANADNLAKERKALIVQQALALLEQGDRAAALALAWVIYLVLTSIFTFIFEKIEYRAGIYEHR